MYRLLACLPAEAAYAAAAPEPHARLSASVNQFALFGFHFRILGHF